MRYHGWREKAFCSEAFWKCCVCLGHGEEAMSRVRLGMPGVEIRALWYFQGYRSEKGTKKTGWVSSQSAGTSLISVSLLCGFPIPPPPYWGISIQMKQNLCSGTVPCTASGHFIIITIISLLLGSHSWGPFTDCPHQMWLIARYLLSMLSCSRYFQSEAVERANL